MSPSSALVRVGDVEGLPSAQTRCHFLFDRLRVVPLHVSSLDMKKPLLREAAGESSRAAPCNSPVLAQKSELHFRCNCSAKLAPVFLTRLGFRSSGMRIPRRSGLTRDTSWGPRLPGGALVRLRLERIPQTGGGCRGQSFVRDRPASARRALVTLDLLHGQERAARHALRRRRPHVDGSVPVRRGIGDRESLRQAREIARDGHLVGIFVGGPGSASAIRGSPAGRNDDRAPGGSSHHSCGIYSFGWTRNNRQPCAGSGEIPSALRASHARTRLQAGRGHRRRRDQPSLAPRRGSGRRGIPARALPDVSKRWSAFYPLRGDSTTPSPSTSVKRLPHRERARRARTRPVHLLAIGRAICRSTTSRSPSCSATSGCSSWRNRLSTLHEHPLDHPHRDLGPRAARVLSRGYW